MNLCSLGLIVFVLSSCGYGSGKRINHMKTYKNFGEPMKLRSSEDCKSAEETSVLAFDGSAVKQIDSYNFSSWNINGVKYRFPIRTVLKGIKLNHILKDSCRSMVHNPWLVSGNCIDQVKQDKKSFGEYQICKAAADENSLDTAASSILYSLNLGIDFLTRHREIMDGLEPIDIILFPEYNFLASFSDSIYKSTMTDNASWSIQRRNKVTSFQLSILPTSDRWVKRGYVPMWQSPFVINHELGHHVFYSLLPEKLKKTYFRDSSLISDYHKHVDDNLSAMTGIIKSNYLEFSSINEAVADLFAFIVLDQKPRDLSRIFCGLSYRNILEDSFPGGSFKTFNDELEGDSNCFDPSGDDPHLWGSIIANATYKILKINSEDSKEKVEKSFFTLLNIYKQKLALSTEKDIENKGLEPYVEALIDFSNKDEVISEECDVINFSFSKRYRKMIEPLCA